MSTGDLGITYGPLRLRIAKYFGVDPGDLSIHQLRVGAQMFENEISVGEAAARLSFAPGPVTGGEGQPQ